MSTITIEIPQKILQRGAPRRLLVVDPKEFEQELRRRWELEDAKQASKDARREMQNGTAREIKSLQELMR